MEGDTADFDTSGEEPRQKKGRHRKKQLYNSILSQMEFYFSDSNLAKDRFLSQLIKENPNVELKIFLKFNKLCKLTTSLDDIRKALTHSTLLQVSEDGSTVARKTPVKETANAEERTIYVERLKGDATHEWVKSIFSEFGKVVYVSIPKYKDKNENKGFAFIEFESEAEAAKALTYFESIDCKIPSNVDPEKIQSVAVYNEIRDEISKSGEESGAKRKTKSVDVKQVGKKSKLEEVKNQTKNETDKAEGSESECKANDGATELVAKKLEPEQQPQIDEAKDDEVKKTEICKVEDLGLKRKTSNEDGAEHVAKKSKIEEAPHADKAKDDESDKNEGGKGEDLGLKRKTNDEDEAYHVAKKPKTEEESQGEEAKDDAKDDENKKKKKLKKEHKKRAHIKEFDLRVLSKKEWRKMRNRYIDLQRKKMKEFKQHLTKQKYSRTPNYGDEVFKKPIEANEQVEDTAKKIEFVPGVIAKIKLNEPGPDPKKLKCEIKNSSMDVQHVEVLRPPKDDEVYVRFTNAKTCKEFCSQPYNGNKVEILNGDQEKRYWKKLFKDRQEKLQKVQAKHKKERGRDKLLRKANKLIPQHVKFDD